jgi:DNA-binding transcriptional ArsR family regulator
MNDVETITQPKRAAAILAHPLRARILARARSPISASDLARSLGQPRQRLNYHVRQLAQTGFLLPVAQQKKRNMLEQQYVASAHSYVLTPDVLGEIAADPAALTDASSAAHLVAVCSVAQTEIAAVMAAAADAGVRLRTISLEADLQFESAAQRTEFAQALAAAVDDVVARHSSPLSARTEGAAGGRPFKLFLGCYPVSRPGNLERGQK